MEKQNKDNKSSWLTWPGFCMEFLPNFGPFEFGERQCWPRETTVDWWQSAIGLNRKNWYIGLIHVNSLMYGCHMLYITANDKSISQLTYSNSDAFPRHPFPLHLWPMLFQQNWAGNFFAVCCKCMLLLLVYNWEAIGSTPTTLPEFNTSISIIRCADILCTYILILSIVSY